jgi:hypothetical protein
MLSALRRNKDQYSELVVAGIPTRIPMKSIGPARLPPFGRGRPLVQPIQAGNDSTAAMFFTNVALRPVPRFYRQA